MSLNETPSADRLHIGIFGKRNSGKSSLINAITGQNIAIVSEIAGTTADPVSKAMEVRGIGPCVFIDTAGFNDVGELGALRVQATKKTIDKIDVAIMVLSDDDFTSINEWLDDFKARGVPVLTVVNKSDLIDAKAIAEKAKKELKVDAFTVSAANKQGISEISEALVRLVPADYGAQSLTSHWVKKGDVVMLVMPQDSEAPKGRLILPQVQVTRDLLDNECTIISCAPETMQRSLNALSSPPDLIITDSQAFKAAYSLKPNESRLTSFSIVLARSKGDIDRYAEGANAVDLLTAQSKVLIAEACTHAPLSEDIGRVKIPNLLRKRFGSEIKIDIVSGVDFPSDLRGYDLIIHCGGCMFNRRYLLTRIENAAAQNVPITNYGIFLAKINGILDKVEL